VVDLSITEFTRSSYEFTGSGYKWIKLEEFTHNCYKWIKLEDFLSIAEFTGSCYTKLEDFLSIAEFTSSCYTNLEDFWFLLCTLPVRDVNFVYPARPNAMILRDFYLGIDAESSIALVERADVASQP